MDTVQIHCPRWPFAFGIFKIPFGRSIRTYSIFYLPILIKFALIAPRPMKYSSFGCQPDVVGWPRLHGVSFPIWIWFWSRRRDISIIQPTVSCQRLRTSFAFWHFYRRSHMSFRFSTLTIFLMKPKSSLRFGLAGTKCQIKIIRTWQLPVCLRNPFP